MHCLLLSGVAFIPVLVLPDHSTVLQDTHAIIQHLEQEYTQQQIKQHHHNRHPQQHLTHNTSSTSTPSSSQGPNTTSQCTVSTTTISKAVGQAVYPMPAPLLPGSVQQAAASQLLELYGDEWLLLPAMHYRWSFPQQRQRLLYQFGRCVFCVSMGRGGV